MHALNGQLNHEKYHVAQTSVALLGHVISEKGIEVDPSKIRDILALPPPSTARQLVTFLQKVRYLACSIHLLSELIAPLQSLAITDTFAWVEDHQVCFEEVKKALVTLPNISPPKWDQEFFVNPSAGETSLGAILMQKDEVTGYMKPLHFSS